MKNEKGFWSEWGSTMGFISVQLLIFVYMAKNGLSWILILPIAFIGLLIWANIMRLNSQRELQKIADDLDTAYKKQKKKKKKKDK